MLVGVVCACGGVESMVRATFKKAGKPDWLSRMIFHGDSGKREWWNSLPDWVKKDPETEMALYYMDTHSKYAIVFGYQNGMVAWGDLADQGVSGQMRAEVIAEKFD